MLNPLFWIALIITIGLCYTSLVNWKLGLILFFIYIQFFGIVKRIILFISLDNLFYNLLVGLQYVFMVCIIVGMIGDRHKWENSSRYTGNWVLFLTLVLFISISFSSLGLGTAVMLAVIQYFPVYIIMVGPRLEGKLLNDLKKILIKMAPVHALYQIIQFIWGPFAYDLDFVEGKSSVTDAFEGDFMRGVPLYDSADPLYLHFAIVFVILLKGKKTAASWLNMSLIITSLILMGNRSGLILLALAVFIWKIIEWKSANKKIVLGVFIFLTLATLNIFSYLLLDVIDTLGALQLGQSDLASRWGQLGTFTDRIVGRKIATDNITLFGMGLGSSGLGASTLANKGVGYDGGMNDIHAHDLLGEIILDFGIVGVIIFAALIWKVYKNSISINEDSPFLAVILASILASSLLGGSFTYGRAGYFVFLFAGYLLRKNQNQHSYQEKLGYV
jgi:hypothetical protein